MLLTLLRIISLLLVFPQYAVSVGVAVSPFAPQTCGILASFQCGTGCCVVGPCCGGGCCALTAQCINAGTAKAACCPIDVNDPTKCGSVTPAASPSPVGYANNILPPVKMELSTNHSVRNRPAGQVQALRILVQAYELVARQETTALGHACSVQPVA
jgi:hypothetical protein